VKKDDAGLLALPPKGRVVLQTTWVVPEVKLEVHAVQNKERDLDATALAQRLGSGLRESEFFVADERETPAGRTFAAATVAGRLSYDLIEEGSTGSPAIIVALEVALIPLRSGLLPVSDNVLVERVIDPRESADDIDAAISARAGGAIDVSVRGLIEKERLRGAPAADLATALRGSTDIALWALDLIADRRELRLLDDVVAQLTARDEKVAQAAITTLVALGERSAVGPLTKLADFQDYEQLRVLIEASASLGGDDAIEFLEFVASGHPDDEIKELAADALKRLRP